MSRKKRKDFIYIEIFKKTYKARVATNIWNILLLSTLKWLDDFPYDDG